MSLKIQENFSGGLVSSFLHLSRGTKLVRYAQLQMNEGEPLVYSDHYTSVDIPEGGVRVLVEGKFINKDTTVLTPGEYVEVFGACTVNPQVVGKYYYQLEPNPDLSAYGIVQGTYYLRENKGIPYSPSFFMEVKREVDLRDLLYVFKLRMRA